MLLSAETVGSDGTAANWMFIVSLKKETSVQLGQCYPPEYVPFIFNSL